MKGRLLIVEDDRSMGELLESLLRRQGYEAAWRPSAEAALLALQAEDYDAIITDLNLRGMSGIDLCRRTASSHPDLPVIVITAFGSMDTAIAAIRAGAYDFIPKPFETEPLVIALGRAVEHRALRQEVRRLRRAVTQGPFEEFIGNSPAMRRVYALLERVASSEAPVFITGETGTGKELVARAVHARSRRKAGPFIAINCAALPEPLLESELFGHARGAFTDARTERTGLFAQADGGVLFLDEIGDLPLSMQPKLLRALQDRRIRPLGSEREIPVDVRIVAATNRDLESAVEEGRFRGDLYFRVNVLHIEMPPLRSRGGDVLLLAQHFLRSAAERSGKSVQGISASVAEKLLSYSWPGNIRELYNCIERAVALTGYEQLVVEDLPEKIRDWRSPRFTLPGDDPETFVPLEELERRYILHVLEAVGGNKSRAARILGLDRKTLHRRLEHSGADTPGQGGEN